jgi:hypothetical protein
MELEKEKWSERRESLALPRHGMPIWRKKGSK